MDALRRNVPRLGRKESQLQTRKALLEAAREVFLETGYQGARLDDIAARAGFTKGALYWHFPNKQTLFLTLISESIEANLGTLDSFLDVEGADPNMLKAKLGEWIDGIDERESLPAFGVELAIEARTHPAFREIHLKMVAGHEAALSAFLDRYFKMVGEQPLMPVAELASTLVTIFKGFALARQNRTDNPPNSRDTVRLLMRLPRAG